MILVYGILLFYAEFLFHNANGYKSSEIDINDFFASSFHENYTLPDIPSNNFRNFTIDIENIDPHRIRRKFEMLQPEITKKEEVLRQSRRQTLTFKGHDYDKMKHASEYMSRTKLADLMLQSIYMARHKLKELEDDPNYIVDDPGFRIGYLYQRLRRIVTRIRHIKNTLNVMNNKPHKSGTNKGLFYYGDTFETMGPGIILHTKAVKLYTDFQYLWKVLIQIDGYKMEQEGLVHKLAPGDKTGGLTEEETSLESRKKKTTIAARTKHDKYNPKHAPKI